VDLVDSKITGKKTELGFTLKTVLEDNNTYYSVRIQINLFTVQLLICFKEKKFGDQKLVK